MPKVVAALESAVIALLSSMLLWQRYQRTAKKWWKRWCAKPKRPWTLRGREPNECQDCRLATAEITRWLERDGKPSEKRHEQLVTGLHIIHSQVDEMFSRVRR